MGIAHRIRLQVATRVFGTPHFRSQPEFLVLPSYAHGKGYYSFRACWRAVCADAELGRLRLHDLRHTVASQAVMSGENLPLVGKILGHKRHLTTAGYAHLADAHLVQAPDLLRVPAPAFALSQPIDCDQGYRASESVWKRAAPVL